LTLHLFIAFFPSSLSNKLKAEGGEKERKKGGRGRPTRRRKEGEKAELPFRARYSISSSGPQRFGKKKGKKKKERRGGEGEGMKRKGGGGGGGGGVCFSLWLDFLILSHHLYCHCPRVGKKRGGGKEEEKITLYEGEREKGGKEKKEKEIPSSLLRFPSFSNIHGDHAWGPGKGKKKERGGGVSEEKRRKGTPFSSSFPSSSLISGLRLRGKEKKRKPPR